MNKSVAANFTVGSETEKSLFDDLELNGAYSTNLVEDAKKSQDELSPNSRALVTASVKKKASKRIEKPDSLFDKLPHQGAMLDTIFDSKTRKRGTFATVQDLLSPRTGDLRFQIELERQPSPAVFTAPNFLPHQFPNQVHQVPNAHTLLPIVPVVQGNSLSQLPSQQYGTPVRAFSPNTNVRNPDSHVIIYGSHVPDLRNSGHSESHLIQQGRNPSVGQQQGYQSRQGQPLFPVILGTTTPSSIRGYGPDTGNQNIHITNPPHSSTFRPPTSTSTPLLLPTSRPVTGMDYDYETLEDTRKRERFRSRTGFFKYNEPSDSYNVPSEEAKSYYNNDHHRPAENYGPPSPPPSYGPPPSPTYRPPQKDPAPARNPQPRPTSTTSISYQTIPIQTVQTQLVTVPQITVSSSTSDADTDEPEGTRPQSPGRPPSTSYGIADSTTRGGGAAAATNRGVFTDEQIELLLSAARGGSGAGLYENDDTISLLLGGGERGVASSFSGNSNLDTLGLGQLGTGRYRLGNSQPTFLNSPIQLPLSQFGINSAYSGLYTNSNPINLGQQLQEQRFRTSNLGALSGTRSGPILTGDAVNAVDDILREQRLRQAVAELRGRLRNEGQSSLRARRDYRSLLYKGALLLGALTLLPAVATPLAAAASGIQTPHFLLPLAASAGRRKRSAELTSERDTLASLFQGCRTDLGQSSADSTNLFRKYIDCIENSTPVTSSDSLFDSIPFNGALIPEAIRSDLQKFMPMGEILKNSECLQKQACETLVEIQKSSHAETVKTLSSAFANDILRNPWVRNAITAAANEKCPAFYCHEEYFKSNPT